MRKLLVVSLVALLAGCATMGVSPDNPKLQTASQNAKEALNKAREVGAKSNRPKKFQELLDRYNALYQKQQNQPTLDLVQKYQDLERNAYRMAISTLQSRFDQLDSRVSQLQSQLEKRVSSLEKQESSLKDKIQVLSERNNKLKQRKKQLKKKIETLTEKNNSLRTKTKNLRERISSLSQKLNQSRSTVEELRSRLENRNQKLTKLQAENRKIQSELKKKLEEGAVRTENERVYITLESRILFNLGDVHVREEIRPELNQIAQTLKKYPDREILVEGHTDDLPLKNELKRKYGSNWELSAQRAINVLKYLVYNRGISKERIGAVAYGQFRPRVPNTSTENRAKNRRVEIVLLPREVPQKTRDLVN